MSAKSSACLIVKNESKVLHKCLASLQPVFDEIIVVDTGSTDNTKEIALEYTDKVYDFTWVNDFAKARNESIKYATGEWILIIDADEYIKENDIDKFKAFFETENTNNYTVYSLNMISYLGEANTSNFSEDLVTRIFPNHKGFYYQHPIHEQLTNKHTFGSKNLPLDLYHTGYLTEVRDEKNKSARNLAIFEEYQKSKVFDAYDNFTLANEYAALGKHDEAHKYYMKSYKKSKFTSAWELKCAYDVYDYFKSKKRYADCINVIETAFSKYKKYPEYYTLYGLIYYELGMYTNAKTYFVQAYDIADQRNKKGQKFNILPPQFATLFPIGHLLKIALSEFDSEKIVSYSIQMLHIDPYNLQCLQYLYIHLSTNSSDQDIISIVEKIYDMESQKDLVLLFSVAVSNGLSSLATYFFTKIKFQSVIPLKNNLLYALIIRQKDLFESHLLELSKENIHYEAIYYVLIANQVWNVDYFSDITSLDWSKYSDLYELITYFNNPILENKSKLDSLVVGKYLSLLFITKNYDLYDQKLNELMNGEVINFLASFFISSNNFDIAVSYLDTLLRDYEPNDLNLLFLARLHLADGLYAEAMPFLVEYLKHKPDSILVHSLIISYTQSEEQKTEYKKLLFDLLPVARKLDVYKK